MDDQEGAQPFDVLDAAERVVADHGGLSVEPPADAGLNKGPQIAATDLSQLAEEANAISHLLAAAGISVGFDNSVGHLLAYAGLMYFRLAGALANLDSALRSHRERCEHCRGQTADGSAS